MAPTLSKEGLAGIQKALETDATTPINKAVLHDAIIAWQMWRRQRSASTKNRREVNGTTKKCVKQKGTGSARHGARTAPIFVGGGVAFGPRPVKFKWKLNKKVLKKAFFDSIRLRMEEKRVAVVAGEKGFSGKTKDVATLFKKSEISRALICGEKGSLVLRGARNLGDVFAVVDAGLTPYDVLNHDWLVFTEGAAEKIAERLKKVGGGKS